MVSEDFQTSFQFPSPSFDLIQMRLIQRAVGQRFEEHFSDSGSLEEDEEEKTRELGAGRSGTFTDVRYF
jgi:hypothetical protein